MESRQQWLTRLKNELSNSPLVSNVAFGFILMGLEKLVELEFECPCSPTWNGVFSSAFFIVPPVIAFTLILIIQKCRCGTGCSRTVSLSSFPAFIWLILLFLDGQYFVCAMTDWEGRFVFVKNAAPKKWCEPTQKGNVTSEELMLRLQQLFVFSQVAGLLILFVICIGLVVYAIRESFRPKGEKDEKDKDEKDEDMEMEERKKLNVKEVL